MLTSLENLETCTNITENKNKLVKNIETNIISYDNLFKLKKKQKNIENNICKICNEKYKKKKKLKFCNYCKNFNCFKCYSKIGNIIICVNCKIKKIIWKKDSIFVSKKNKKFSKKEELLINLKAKEIELGIYTLKINKIDTDQNNFIKEISDQNKLLINKTIDFQKNIEDINNKITEFNNFFLYFDKIENNIKYGCKKKDKIIKKITIIENDIKTTNNSIKDLILNIKFIINMIRKNIKKKRKKNLKSNKKGYFCF